MKQFTKQNLNEVRAEIDKALLEVGNKLGIDLSIGSIRFDSSSFRTTLSANVKEVQAPEDPALETPTTEKGIIGRKFYSNGVQFTIVAWNYRRYKYPITATNPKGVRYKFPQDVVARAK
jgi:hypothetical protein